MRGLLRTFCFGFIGLSLVVSQPGCGGNAKVDDTDLASDLVEVADGFGDLDAMLPDTKTDLPGEVGPEVTTDADDTAQTETLDLPPDITGNRPSEVGQIVISEFMAQSTVGNDAGEWVELYNASDVALELAGCFMKDAATDSVPLTGSLLLQPGDYLVLGVSYDVTVNGGLDPDFLMAGYLLDNYGDTIRLECDGLDIDSVTYEGNWVVNGVARQLDKDHMDAVSNDSKANWCLAGFNYGGKGKLGSPGATNEKCEVVNPCEPNPCTGAPASSCQDSVTLKQSKVPGTCTVVNNQPSCEFEIETIDCSLSDKVCKNGACIVPPDPCQPNPCTVPPQPTCDGNLANTHVVPGACSNNSGTAKCVYTPQQVNCALEGKVCVTGACQYEGQGLAPSAAGQVIVSEFMAKSQSGTDGGEWIEFFNTSSVALDLNGCALKDKANENIVIAEPLVIPAGGYLLFAKSDDSVANHGLTPDYIAPFALANDGDKIILVCNGVEIDRIEYNGTWVTQGVATQLNSKSMDGVSNDTLINWCPAVATYGTDALLGTPGLPNSECQIPVTIYKCRLQEPLDVTQEAGTDLTVLGRVAAFSLTDLTSGNDPNPLLKGQAGFGPVNTNPATAAGWTWFDALPADGWDAMAAGELDMDQYTATYLTPGTGNYHHAYRFSVDGGTTWTYCDRNAGAGADGSENGYQITNAGTLKTTPGANPCEPNPCTTPNADVCSLDGLSVLTYVNPGLCSVVEGAATCQYTETTIDCTLDGKACIGGLCVAEGEGNIPTAKGQVLITEFMAQSQSGTDEGEWIEIYNNTATVLDLAGCKLTDLEATATFPVPYLFAPGEYLVLARSADPAKNHGLTVDFVYSGIALSNDPGDQIYLSCGETSIDQVEYTKPWIALGIATQLNPAAFDAVSNDLQSNWCLATGAYGTAGKLGTPGAANVDCVPPVPPAVDWCRFQAPATADVIPNGTLVVSGRVLEAGKTDVTNGVDSIQGFVAQAGLGTFATNPATDSSWAWVAGTGTVGWDAAAAGEPGLDEYQATLTAPATVAAYQLAWRFSLDSGATWAYCDLDKGDGFDGSEDGYSAANAAVLNVVEPLNPCSPNPCQTLPASICDSSTVARHYSVPGECTVDGTNASCNYLSTTEDCNLSGKICVAGLCKLPGEGDRPMAGEVFVTEFMANPVDSADVGEWIELYNIASVPLDLGGCVLKDNGTNNHVIVGPLVVAPGDFVVLARSGDPVLNHGLVAPYVYSNFTLANTGDAIVLECDSALVDSVVYTTALLAVGASAQLSSLHFDEVDNDLEANWCLSKTGFGTDGQYGTPGTDNGDCAPASIDWCRFQFPLSASVETNQNVTVYGRIYEAGTTDLTAGVDAFPGLVIQAGFGPDGSTPGETWNWTNALGTSGWDAIAMGEPNNDEYTATFVPATAGEFDMAFRVSLEAGVWTYCDLDKGDGMDGSENGYAPSDSAPLTVVVQANPCSPNPCTGVLPVCNLDATKAIESVAPGTCVNNAGAAECTYSTVEVDCAGNGKVCVDGYCVLPPLPKPAVGEVIFTELMVRALAGTTDNGEYVELHNTTTKDLDISGCLFKDAGASFAIPAGTTLVAGDYLVLVKSSDPAGNFGCPFDFAWGTAISLTNGGEALTFECATVAIDTVTYGGTFDDIEGASAQLKNANLNATDNDTMTNWCTGGFSTYGTAGKRGTPGSVNDDCVAPVMDWCRFQAPTSATVGVGASVTTYGRIYEAGLTTATTGVDAIPFLKAQAGFGADGSTPDNTWTWVDALGTPGWDGMAMGEPNNDEYTAVLIPGVAGTYDMAYRVSLDNGATWLYCDLDKGDGLDGSENGYAASDSASLTVQPPANPCDPNPCTVGKTAECNVDNTKAIEYVVPGNCAVVANVAECTYQPNEIDCAGAGKVCSNGACVATGLPKPAVGQVIFTEVMARAISGTTDDGEYVELFNTTATDLDVSGCLFKDSAASFAIPANTTLAAGGYMVLVKGSDPTGNFGIPFNFAWGTGITLSNSGEALTFECASTAIDSVSYPSSLVVLSISAQLKTDKYNGTDNDTTANWCTTGTTTYGATGKRGTPGAVTNCL